MGDDVQPVDEQLRRCAGIIIQQHRLAFYARADHACVLSGQVFKALPPRRPDNGPFVWGIHHNLPATRQYCRCQRGAALRWMQARREGVVNIEARQGVRRKGGGGLDNFPDRAVLPVGHRTCDAVLGKRDARLTCDGL